MHQQRILAFTVRMVVELVTAKQKNREISECDSNPNFY
jgi:hypothetical protein